MAEILHDDRHATPALLASPNCCYPVAMSDRSLASGAAGAAAAVSSRAAPHAIGTTFSVILSLSFCHLLNDMMQSLVPALYPILKSSYGLSFSQVGLITLAFQCTASMLQPVVGLYTDRQPTTVFPDGRHRPHPGRPPVDVPSLDVSRDPARRHVDRDGLVDLPSRSLPCGAHGGRRTLWARPVPVPGRREHWLGLRPIARRVCRRPARAVEHCVVLGCGADRHRRAAAGR